MTHREIELDAGRSVANPAAVNAKTVRTNALTSKEREILVWLSLGKSAPEAAIILGRSVCTVRAHIQSIKRKLDASNIPHAVSRAFEMGLLGSL
jgi:LuxR family quorum-sensing system transcriptional regulator ExpR